MANIEKPPFNIPTPSNERERLESLLSYQILDTPEEEVYDNIVELASKICKTPISMVTLIDKDRQWFKAYKGSPFRQSPREISVCSYAILEDDLTMVTDSFEDERFKNNPLVANKPHIRFYAGIPLTNSDGFNLGTLCVMDLKPKELNEDQIFALRVLAEQVMSQMELRKKVREIKESATVLSENYKKEYHLNNLLNRLLLIISHDFRAPLTSLQGMLNLLSNELVQKEDAGALIANLSTQVENTLTFLEDLLVWAKSKVQGVPTEKKLVNIHTRAKKMIGLAAPKIKLKALKIDNQIDPNLRVYASEQVVNLVIRNLINNAIKFCDTEDHITLSSEEKDNLAIIRVKDNGPGADYELIQNLLNGKPKYDSIGSVSDQGSGLGLMLCKDSIEENGGKMFIEPTNKDGLTIGFELPTSKPS